MHPPSEILPRSSRDPQLRSRQHSRSLIPHYDDDAPMLLPICRFSRRAGGALFAISPPPLPGAE
eukprot:851957-Prorocentrum_minimum.AAC.2